MAHLREARRSFIWRKVYSATKSTLPKYFRNLGDKLSASSGPGSRSCVKRTFPPGRSKSVITRLADFARHLLHQAPGRLPELLFPSSVESAGKPCLQRLAIASNKNETLALEFVDEGCIEDFGIATLQDGVFFGIPLNHRLNVRRQALPGIGVHPQPIRRPHVVRHAQVLLNLIIA